MTVAGFESLTEVKADSGWGASSAVSLYLGLYIEKDLGLDSSLDTVTSSSKPSRGTAKTSLKPGEGAMMSSLKHGRGVTVSFLKPGACSRVKGAISDTGGSSGMQGFCSASHSISMVLSIFSCCWRRSGTLAQSATVALQQQATFLACWRNSGTQADFSAS